MSAVLNDPLDDSRLDLRPMVEGDLSYIVQIERMAYSFPWTRSAFRDCLRAGYCCRVLEREGIMTGYGIMSVNTVESHILNLCVDPGRHRMGLGRFLLVFMLDLARKYNAETTFLEVRLSNQAARQFYQEVGFVEVEIQPGYYPARFGREDAVVMAMEIL